MTISIIGSSFSGLAAALFFVAQGQKPNLFDSGTDKPDMEIEQFEEGTYKGKNPLDISKFDHNWKYFKLPGKVNYLFADGVNVRPTYVKGGFSGLWGGSVQAYPNNLRQNWVKDKKLWTDAELFLEEIFPIVENSQISGVNLTEEIELINKDISQSFNRLSNLLNHEIEIKDSKFAVSYRNLEYQENIIHGIQKHLKKFDAKSIIDDLKKRELINYFPNHTLREFNEIDRKVKLVFEIDGVKSIKYTEYLFIGAGSISTSKMLLDSGLHREIRIKDTQLIYMPSFRFRTNKMNYRKNENILFPSAFITIRKKFTTEIFYQFYPMNKLMRERIYILIPKFLRLFEPFLRSPLKRFGVLFGYLPANKSGTLSLSNNDNNITKVEVANEPTLNYSLKLKIITILSFLKIGVVPFPFLTRYAGVGESYHMGASTFLDSTGLERGVSNEDGLLVDHTSVYIIDSSSLPQLEPVTITYEVMLNAIRIVMKATMETTKS